MEIEKQIAAFQERSNQLAIQESNLRAKIQPLEILNQQLKLVLTEKNQLIGAINALQGLVAEQGQSAANDGAGSGAERRHVR